MQQLKIVLAGGSGFIGRALAERWGKDNRVVILSRHRTPADAPITSPAPSNGIFEVYWDGESAGNWCSEIDGCDLLINLAGKSVNCRYTEANKAAIFSSRLDSTHALGECVSSVSKPPALWINASSATIYPHATDHPYDESSVEREGDFSVKVVEAWEAEFNKIPLPQTRKALLRTTIVLGQGGALAPYARLARWGLGGPQGSGEQMFSWLHMEDFARIIEWLWEHPEQDGVFNAAAPVPVRNELFMAMLRKFYSRKTGLPAPAWLLNFAARIIGTETELLLKSRWVLPTRLVKAGFSFTYPELSGALKNLLSH